MGLAALGLEQDPVVAGGLDPPGEEGVAGGQEGPAVGLEQIASLGMPEPGLGVVHLELQPGGVLGIDHYTTVAPPGLPERLDLPTSAQIIRYTGDPRIGAAHQDRSRAPKGVDDHTGRHWRQRTRTGNLRSWRRSPDEQWLSWRSSWSSVL